MEGLRASMRLGAAQIVLTIARCARRPISGLQASLAHSSLCRISAFARKGVHRCPGLPASVSIVCSVIQDGKGGQAPKEVHTEGRPAGRHQAPALLAEGPAGQGSI